MRDEVFHYEIIKNFTNWLDITSRFAIHGRLDTWPSRIITNISQKQSISTGEIYSMICVEWAVDLTLF